MAPTDTLGQRKPTKWPTLLFITGTAVLLSTIPTPPLFGAAAASSETPPVSLTEESLKLHDGTNPSLPIYLAINGTIYDVSASPSFYGPGGHYNHFVGKDATRAWITECWDSPDQFTWRLDDVEAMFMPKYLDEMFSDVGEGKFDSGLGDLENMPQDMLQGMAAKALDRVGRVGPKARAKRRVADKEEADAKVQETLAHWVKFFEGNAKYKAVGRVVLDQSRAAPPPPCQKAMDKRPVKGGKLESLMGSMGNLMGGAMGNAGKGDAKKGEMPAAVKEQIEKAKKQAAEAKDGIVEDVKEKVKDNKDAAADAAESIKVEAGKKVAGATDVAAEGTEAVKRRANIVSDSAAELAGSVKISAVEAAEVIKQKATEAKSAAADTVESVTVEAGKQAKAAGEEYESIKQKAQEVKDQGIKQAAEGVAAGAEKVKQKAEEVRADHDEL